MYCGNGCVRSLNNTYKLYNEKRKNGRTSGSLEYNCYIPKDLYFLNYKMIDAKKQNYVKRVEQIGMEVRSSFLHALHEKFRKSHDFFYEIWITL